MKCYRVVILDENQKVLISKIVTAGEETLETITDRIRVVIRMYHAPFTVHVAEYIHDTMNILEMMAYLNTALTEMSLFGVRDERGA